MGDVFVRGSVRFGKAPIISEHTRSGPSTYTKLGLYTRGRPRQYLGSGQSWLREEKNWTNDNAQRANTTRMMLKETGGYSVPS
jgi:hypothetical protein